MKSKWTNNTPKHQTLQYFLLKFKHCFHKIYIIKQLMADLKIYSNWNLNINNISLCICWCFTKYWFIIYANNIQQTSGVSWERHSNLTTSLSWILNNDFSKWVPNYHGFPANIFLCVFFFVFLLFNNILHYFFYITLVSTMWWGGKWIYTIFLVF